MADLDILLVAADIAACHLLLLLATRREYQTLELVGSGKGLWLGVGVKQVLSTAWYLYLRLMKIVTFTFSFLSLVHRTHWYLENGTKLVPSVSAELSIFRWAEEYSPSDFGTPGFMYLKSDTHKSTLRLDILGGIYNMNEISISLYWYWNSLVSGFNFIHFEFCSKRISETFCCRPNEYCKGKVSFPAQSVYFGCYIWIIMSNKLGLL